MAKSKANIKFVIDCSDKRNEYIFDMLFKSKFSVERYSALINYADIYKIENTEQKEVVFLFAPLTEIDLVMAEKIPNMAKVFCFRIQEKAAESFIYKDVKVYNYFDDEILAMKNAYLTAEGTLKLVIENTEISLKDLSVLVLGYGRVGKCVTDILNKNDCKTAVAVRNIQDTALASIHAAAVFDFKSYEKYLNQFDVIINTVPALIIKKRQLAKVKQDCLIIDLASKPGGIDFETAKEMEINTIHALGIPGKTSPKTAGKYILESVFQLLEKEQLSTKSTKEVKKI